MMGKCAKLRSLTGGVFAALCRCGPFEPALQALQDDRVKQLVNKMVSATFPLSEGVQAFHKASTKGVLKVQLIC